jgi:hypothetical protein
MVGGCGSDVAIIVAVIVAINAAASVSRKIFTSIQDK